MGTSHCLKYDNSVTLTLIKTTQSVNIQVWCWHDCCHNCRATFNERYTVVFSCEYFYVCFVVYRATGESTVERPSVLPSVWAKRPRTHQAAEDSHWETTQSKYKHWRSSFLKLLQYLITTFTKFLIIDFNLTVNFYLRVYLCLFYFSFNLILQFLY